MRYRVTIDPRKHPILPGQWPATAIKDGHLIEAESTAMAVHEVSDATGVSGTILQACAADIVITKARYAKNMHAVRCESNGSGWKSRAMRLADSLSRSRYSNRENAYIMSPTKSAKLVKLYAEGWDANSFSGELCPPDGVPIA